MNKIIIIGIIVLVIVTIGLGANMMSENAKYREIDLSRSAMARDPSDYELENRLGQLKEIFGSCNCQTDPERTCEHTLIVWQNSTHYIDNNLCEFITLEEYQQSLKDT